MPLSRSAVDRIGEKLRRYPKDPSSQAELLLYCEQVRIATSSVRSIVTNSTTTAITSRDGKSFRSIVDKLNRQSVRLSQIQDIEGCRCVVDTIVEQDALYRRIDAQFEMVKIDDRRKNPTNGYRAVHVIPTVGGERYEIQIRSRLQHLWAQAIETIADSKDDISFKYGGGDPEWQDIMLDLSIKIGGLEASERAAFHVAAYADYGDVSQGDLNDTEEYKGVKEALFAEFELVPVGFRESLKAFWGDRSFDIREITGTIIELRTFAQEAISQVIGRFSTDGEQS